METARVITEDTSSVALSLSKLKGGSMRDKVEV